MQVVSLTEAKNNLKAVFDSVYLDADKAWQQMGKKILKKIKRNLSEGECEVTIPFFRKWDFSPAKKARLKPHFRD